MDADSADLMSIGEHCSCEDCRQRDFLPFTCDCCEKVFCLEHRTYQSHNCPKAGKKDSTVIVCPLCAKGIKLSPTDDAQAAFDRHTAEGCDPANYAKVHRKPRCPVPGCKEKLTSVNTYNCKQCAGVMCLKHRFPSDHKCTGASAAGSAAARRQAQQFTNPFKNLFSGASSSSATPAARPQPKPQIAPKQAKARPPPQQPVSRVAAPAAALPEACAECGARFQSVMELIRHSEAFHQGAVHTAAARRGAVESCPHCGMAFHDPVALVEHVERTHGNSSSCALC